MRARTAQNKNTNKKMSAQQGRHRKEGGEGGQEGRREDDFSEREEGVVTQALEELYRLEVVEVEPHCDHVKGSAAHRRPDLEEAKAAALLAGEPERKPWVLLVLRVLQGDVVV